MPGRCSEGLPERLDGDGYDGAVHTPTNRQVLLIGAGGHARVCLEALRDMGDLEVVGAVSADGTGIAGLGVPVLGTESDVKNITESMLNITLCVAIGDNRDPARCHEKIDGEWSSRHSYCQSLCHDLANGVVR